MVTRKLNIQGGQLAWGLQRLWSPSIALLILMVLSRMVWMQLRTYSITVSTDLVDSLGDEHVTAAAWQREVVGALLSPQIPQSGFVFIFSWIPQILHAPIQVKDFLHFHFVLVFFTVMSCLFVARMTARGWWVALTVATMILSRGRLIEMIGQLSPGLTVTTMITVYFMWVCHYFMTGSTYSFLASLCAALILSGLCSSFCVFIPLVTLWDIVGACVFTSAVVRMAEREPPRFFHACGDWVCNQMVRRKRALGWNGLWLHSLSLCVFVAVGVVLLGHKELCTVLVPADLRSHEDWVVWGRLPVPLDAHLLFSLVVVFGGTLTYFVYSTPLAKLCAFMSCAWGMLFVANVCLSVWGGDSEAVRGQDLWSGEHVWSALPILVEWFEPVILSVALVGVAKVVMCFSLSAKLKPGVVRG